MTSTAPTTPPPTRPIDLPADADQWLPFITSWSSDALARAAEAIDDLVHADDASPARLLDLWNDSEIALRQADSLASLIAEVHPDAAVRDAAEAATQKAAAARVERGLDRRIFDALSALDATTLDEQAARVLDQVLRDYRRSGITLEPAAQQRLREIAERSIQIEQDFSRNIRDDVRAVSVPVAALDGLPEDFRTAHPATDGMVSITTDTPDYGPFRMYSTDATARRDLTTEYLVRAWPVNDALLRELVALRFEQARLLGFESWPDFDADVKMAKNGATIAEFIDQVKDAADAAGRRDLAELLDRKRREFPEADSIDASEGGYYSELIRKEKHLVDSQEVRTYFDFGKVRAGLLSVTSRLLGIDYVEVQDAPSWHPDVAVFDVIDRAPGSTRAGERIGRIHLDLHPREGKYKHAAQFDIAVGITDRQLAEGALVCNLPTGLMQHTDVETLFHEFGHLVHHILGGDQRWAQFSGVATEWDFVEAPSQLLEEWAWDARVLQSFATNDTGEVIPADLIERMRAASEFGNGLWARTQLFYAALSYRLHEDRPEDQTAALIAIQDDYDLFRYIPGTHMHASFGHLTGYSSAYYTYLWSLVIAKDLFSAFDPDDLFDQAIARRYRDEILAPGGRRDARDLVERFLGRDYDFDAFRAWLER